MQQEQEAADNAPLGFKNYNAGDYRLFVPFPYSLEGRENGGAVLLGSRLGATNTEVLTGTPIPIRANISDSDQLSTAVGPALDRRSSGLTEDEELKQQANHCLGNYVWLAVKPWIGPNFSSATLDGYPGLITDFRATQRDLADIHDVLGLMLTPWESCADQLQLRPRAIGGVEIIVREGDHFGELAAVGEEGRPNSFVSSSVEPASRIKTKRAVEEPPVLTNKQLSSSDASQKRTSAPTTSCCGPSTAPTSCCAAARRSPGSRAYSRRTAARAALPRIRSWLPGDSDG